MVTYACYSVVFYPKILAFHLGQAIDKRIDLEVEDKQENKRLHSSIDVNKLQPYTVKSIRRVCSWKCCCSSQCGCVLQICCDTFSRGCGCFNCFCELQFVAESQTDAVDVLCDAVVLLSVAVDDTCVAVNDASVTVAQLVIWESERTSLNLNK